MADNYSVNTGTLEAVPLSIYKPTHHNGAGHE